MSKLIDEMPDEMYSQLRKTASLSDRTLRDIVIELVQDYLATQQRVQKLRSSGCLVSGRLTGPPIHFKRISHLILETGPLRDRTFNSGKSLVQSQILQFKSDINNPRSSH